MVKEIASATEFDSELTAAGSKLVVVDFHAVWCGPCKVISPVFQSLATQHPNVVFLKVDVDRVQPVAQRYGVRAMPTFLFLKNKSVVETLQGANPARLTALVKQHSSGSSSSFSGSGQTLSGSSSSTSGRPSANANPVAGIIDGHSSLLSLVEPSQSSALNEKPDRRLHDILKGPSGGKWLESDADEQLLIHLSFKQRVKLSGILLRTLPSHFAHAPKQVKVFANRANLSFDDATSEKADQEFKLTEEHVKGGEAGGGGRVFALRFVKFQTIDSVTIAVLTNQEDAESTRIDALDVFGLPGETTNISDLKKLGAAAEARDVHGRPVSKTGLKGGSGCPPRSNSIPDLASTSYTERPSRHSRSHSTPSLGPLPASKLRRQSSSASAPAIAEEDEGDEGFEEPEGPSERRSSSIPLSPPYLSREEDMDFEAAQAAEADRESFGGWHYAPLIIAMAPPLGALLGGHSDAWSDAILLILASFWLYQFLRVPWEIYYTSRTRRILSHEAEQEADAIYEDGAEQKEAGSRGESVASDTKSNTTDSSRREAREAAAAELRRSELTSLLFCVLSPLLGAYMLHWMRETMVDGGRYLNAFNIRLFTLAAGIKPWSHAIKLVRRRMLHLQEEVHYPSSKVEGMNQRLRRLEADLSALRKLYATKSDLRVLREFDAQLGRAVRRSERKEEHLRLTAEEKFSMVESRLEDLLREVAINAELIEEERRERERAASLRISLFEAVKYLLGSGLTIRRASPKHYLHDVPRSLPTSAALGIGMGVTSPTGEQSFASLQNATSPRQSVSPSYPMHSSPPTQPHLNGKRNPSSPPKSEMHAVGKYSQMQLNGHAAQQSPQSQQQQPSHHLQALHHSQQHHQLSSAWWERGLAFYLFLPLNVSSAAVKFAGEKVRSVMEDSQQEAAMKKRKRLSYQKHLAEHHNYQREKQQQQQQQQQQHYQQPHQVQTMVSPSKARAVPTPNISITSPPSGLGRTR